MTVRDKAKLEVVTLIVDRMISRLKDAPESERGFWHGYTNGCRTMIGIAETEMMKLRSLSKCTG